MIHFTPTLDAKETSQNIKNFIDANMTVFWDILKPLLPFIIGFYLFDAVVTAFMPVNPETGEHTQFGLGGLIAGYFYTALIISWHRVVIHGPDNYTPMNPFKPQKHELIFLIMGVFVGAGIVLSIAIPIGLLTALLGPAGIALGIIPALVFGFFLFYRLCFYFPAKAVDSSITLKESFALSKGYIWKLIWSSLRASFKTILIMMGYILIVMFFAGFLLTLVLGPVGAGGLIGNLVMLILMLPVYGYFQPLLTVISVTALSNYYQYAIRHKSQ